MASVNPLLGPNSGDKPWVDRISKTLKKHLAITIDTPPVSIFQIPKSIKEQKLEAYVPQRIGLGPIHHFQTELYQKMEQNKLNAVKRVLKPYQIPDCEDQVVEKIREIIPIICACYDFYLHADDDTLAWLFAIDGLFLIDQLRAYCNQKSGIEAKDLIMLENQIPLIVLKEIRNTLSSRNEQEDYLESMFGFFSKSHSPFPLSEEKIDFRKVNHLLDYMYLSIVNKQTSCSSEVYTCTDSGSDPCQEKDTKQELLEAFIQITEMIPGSKPFVLIIEYLKSTFSKETEEKETIEEIKIPSVSKLVDIAGVKFHLSPTNRGIRNIKFVPEKERSCYLPRITLDINSEVILRNLLIHENLMAKNSFITGYGLELTEYVDFMCGIIDNTKDVKLLREKKIIESDLGDEEIVELFNGIGRSLLEINEQSELRKIVFELNKVYESVLCVRVQMMVEKHLRGSAKKITVAVSILSTLLVIREVYLKVFGSNPPHLMLVDFVKSTMSNFLQ